MRVHPSSWPIRWRLAALNVAVLVATIFGLGGVLLLQLDNALVGITADNLREQARPTLRERRPPPEFERRMEGLAPPFTLAGYGPIIVRALSGPDTGVVVFDQTGNIVASTDTPEAVEDWPSLKDELVRLALAGQETQTVVPQETRRTLVLLLPARTSDGTVVGALQVSRSLDLVQQLEGRLRLALLLGMLIAAIVAGTLTLRLTRAALQPLDSVVHAARKIGGGEIRERLRLDRRDEIGLLAEAFDAMLDRLSEMIASQRRFVADAAHELRTPLTALGGMVEMLQMGADRGDRATIDRMLNSMEKEIARLTRLVRDLLSLSHLDAEQPLLNEPVELAPLVSEVANDTRLLSAGQEIDTAISAAPIVLGDRDRLKQALLNLAANALAFTPPGGRVRLDLRERGQLAELVVSDTGVGIAADLLPRVMDRFVRADPSRSRATGGSGLGLPIARSIVEAHGGTIRLESEEGQGTRAIIELPIVRRSANGRAAAQHPVASTPS
jgi:signal transduction histidine kinase